MAAWISQWAGEGHHLWTGVTQLVIFLFVLLVWLFVRNLSELLIAVKKEALWFVKVALKLPHNSHTVAPSLTVWQPSPHTWCMLSLWPIVVYQLSLCRGWHYRRLPLAMGVTQDWIMDLDCFSSSRFLGENSTGLSFSNVCLVVRYHLRLD